ncbi:MAG: HAD-IIB family hydrolase [Gammaproteobacteria bacterium]|nr:HAD-IIB family hydrolase [Gammaproteobacteria bacterium]
MSRHLLCTDLDRTLIPNGVQPESLGARETFQRLVERDDVQLAYVSGRHRELIEQAIDEYDLPQPDFVIADVGSTVYQVGQRGWQRRDEWDEQIAPDWGDLSRESLAKLLHVFGDLRLQEPVKQNLHKLSFYVDLSADSAALKEQMRRLLDEHGVKANLIWSIDEAEHIGLLDVLPASANKLHAIEFLMRQQGYGRLDTVFAGDSGNDLDVLQSDVPAVLVANASPELKQQVAHLHKASLCTARGGFLGMNGNYSAGILEGAAYHWPEIEAWLLETH